MDRPRRWLWRQGQWTSTHNLLHRAVRETLRLWLKEANAGVMWSMNTVRSELERRFTRSIETQFDEMQRLAGQLKQRYLSRMPGAEAVKRMLDKGDLILRRASNHPLLGALLNCRFEGEWQPLDPFELTDVEGGKAYMTPDIIIRGPERWVLIRLKTNAWTSGPDDPSELELSGMVMWAVLQHTLPEGEDNYEIALLSHVEKSGWRTWRRPVRRGETRMLSDMIRSDLKESRLLVHKAGPLLDLSRIPLAEKKTRCRDCGYRFTCPGGKDMLLAKLQQHAAEMVGTSE